METTNQSLDMYKNKLQLFVALGTKGASLYAFLDANKFIHLVTENGGSAYLCLAQNGTFAMVWFMTTFTHICHKHGPHASK